MSFKGWKEVPLGDIAQYTNTRVNTDILDLNNYISTENMLPNKAGKTIASSIPKGTCIKYKRGQTLISNIRPYFQKIWYASVDGGCSSDVLVFDIKSDIDSKYFYYYLNQDAFFEYIMAGSKGTKMPRGDKQQILMYPFKYPEINEQKAIAHILSTLDEKIKINNQINKTLENMAQAIFKQWFVDFEFPNEDGEPYKSSGGEMIESELGMIPKGWGINELGDIIDIHDSKRIPLSKNEREKREKIFPYYGAASLMDYVDDYIFDGIYVLLGEDGTVINEDETPVLQYVWGKFWVNNHSHVLTGKLENSINFLYVLLKSLNVRSAVTGAVQLKINQKNLCSLKIVLPKNHKIISKYINLINYNFDNYRILCEENNVLKKIRDSLLPKLMSGEIRVPFESEGDAS